MLRSASGGERRPTRSRLAALADWFRQHPHLRMRCVVPIQSDGNTIELKGPPEA